MSTSHEAPTRCPRVMTQAGMVRHFTAGFFQSMIVEDVIRDISADKLVLSILYCYSNQSN